MHTAPGFSMVIRQLVLYSVILLVANSTVKYAGKSFMDHIKLNSVKTTVAFPPQTLEDSRETFL